MHLERTTSPRHLGIVRLAVGICLLCLFLFSTTPIAPGLTALLGLADRSHHLAVHQSTRGIQVVLQHDCPNSPTHRHGLVARALVMIAERPSGSRADHVIEFSASSTPEKASALTIAVAPGSVTAEVFPVFDLSPFSVRSAVVRTQPPHPPDANGFLQSVRATVLLI